MFSQPKKYQCKYACILGKLTQYEKFFPLYKYANRLTNTKHYIFIFKKKLEIFCKYHKISERITNQSTVIVLRFWIWNGGIRIIGRLWAEIRWKKSKRITCNQISSRSFWSSRWSWYFWVNIHIYNISEYQNKQPYDDVYV